MMRNFAVIFIAACSTISLCAQTNTFPLSGDVGIGTTTPSSKLEVVGEIRNSHGVVSMPLGDWRTLIVAGSASEYYPVRIPTVDYRRDFVEIMQPWVHADGAGYGSMHFIAQFNNNGWGSVVSVNRLLLNTRQGSNSYVARFSDAAHGMIPVLWLRGDQTYVYRVTNNGSLSVVGYAANAPVYDSSADQYDRYVSPISTPDETVPWITGYEISTANGNVGIGTASPSAKFDVVGGEVRFPGAGGGFTHFNYYTGRNYIRGTTIIADSGGNVGIGTAEPQHKLSVNGTIKAKEVIVETTGWADDVFAPDYALPSLGSVAQHIAEKRHLPGIPSAAEVAEHGVAVGDMQAALLRKVEELTLYLIETRKENAELRRRLETLEAAR